MAISPLLKAVYRMATSGDDVARVADDVVGAVRNITPKKQAVARMADEVVEKADDWGWKGGKPGEITGGMVLDNPSELVRPFLQQLQKDQVLKVLSPYDLSPSSSISDWALRDNGMTLAQSFAEMERAGVPRRYTGKLMKSLTDVVWNGGKPLGDFPRLAAQASRSMRGLTNDQRETFVSLLPEWSGSIDDLAEAARSL